LFFLGALSKLLLLLLTMLLVALTNLLSSLAPLFFQVIEPLLLYSPPPLLPESIRLFFLSFEEKTLLFEESFAIEALLLLSTQFLVETDLLLSFSSKSFLLLFNALLLFQQKSLFLEALLFLQFPPPPLLECLPFLPLRLPLRSLSTLTLCLPLLFGCRTLGL
jgi:hypothetical protein